MLTSALLSRAHQAATEATFRRAVLTISAAVLATVGLAACGGSSTPAASTSSAPPASAPPSSAAPATSRPPATSTSGTSGGSVNVCSVLTSAQVASITHEVVEVSKPTDADGISACAYALGNSIFEVEVAPSASAIGWTGFSTLVSSEAKPAGSATSVPRLGQQAISSSVGVAVQGVKYDYLVLHQNGQAANQLSNDIAMAKVLLRALG